MGDVLVTITEDSHVNKGSSPPGFHRGPADLRPPCPELVEGAEFKFFLIMTDFGELIMALFQRG